MNPIVAIVLVLGLWPAVLLAQPRPIETVPGMPPVPDPGNLYSEIAAGKLAPATAGALERIYVPNRQSNDVYVIDPATMKVVDKFRVGINPQHVVPSWDLKTLWVTNNAEGRTDGSLTPIDPMTGKPGKTIPVEDPYNMYFTPDGRSALVVAEALKRLDFRDPQTMKLQRSLAVPRCAGINHADFSIDGRYAIFTCEFAGDAREDRLRRRQGGRLPQALARRRCRRTSAPRPTARCSTSPTCAPTACSSSTARSSSRSASSRPGSGRTASIRAATARSSTSPTAARTRFTAPGAARAASRCIDFATRTVVATWPIPGGGSPDMGNVSADGKTLWLSGRYDDVVYAIDTTTGAVQSIPVGREPHGLTVWPQPGRYSIGHTGNLR